VRDTVAKGGRILFVGTKRQAQKPVAEAAEKCAQYYMNHRWLGGTLTNWKTVSQSIQRLKQIDEVLGAGAEGLTKKERLNMERDQAKLQASAGRHPRNGRRAGSAVHHRRGQGRPGHPGSAEAGHSGRRRGRHQLLAQGRDYVIPGNDDAARAIALYCDLIARAALDGMSAQMGAAGVDLGALEAAPEEEAVAEA
jgi:small subunit ribosomal protein S2